MEDVLSEIKPSTSPYLHYLDEYENKKTEFLGIGRIASEKLFQKGCLEEAHKICETVLAIDPEDIDTQDLKEKVQYYITHPEAQDHLTILKGMEQNCIPDGLRPRLVRSVSERRYRRRAQLWPPSCPVPEKGLNVFNSESVDTDSTENVFFTNGNSPLAKHSTTGSGLQRSKSESAKPSGSVLQKIKTFEAQARKSAGETDVNSNKLETDKVKRPSRRVKINSSNSTIEVKSLSPQITNGHAHTTEISNGKSIGFKSNFKTEESRSFAGRQILAAEKPLIQCQSNRSEYLQTGSVIWTQAGSAVKGELRELLLKELFASTLLTSACWTNSNGEILGVSIGSKISQNEIQIILNGMQKREYFTSSRITLGGITYSCLSATGHVVRARAGLLGINFTTFNRSTVICFYSHPVLPKPVGKLVQHIEKFLTESGFCI